MMQTNLDYATIRRCQEEAAKTVDGLYMASIADVGEEHGGDRRMVEGTKVPEKNHRRCG